MFPNSDPSGKIPSYSLEGECEHEEDVIEDAIKQLEKGAENV